MNQKPNEKQIKKGLGSAIAAAALCLALFNLAFIIPDLIFANQGSDCVRSSVPGFPFTLQTWLRVDAYTRIGILIFLLIVAIATCASLTCGAILIGLYACIFILYSLFSIAWFIVGAIMFWGHLNPSGKCTGGVQIYMHIMLISTILMALMNCLLGGSGGSSFRDAATMTQPNIANVPHNPNQVYKY